MAGAGIEVPWPEKPSRLAAPDWRETLHGHLVRLAAEPARRLYAVLDGAQFDDLPAELRGRELAHRSLYVDVADHELVLAGPWLVDLHHLPASEAEPRAEPAPIRSAVEAGDPTAGGMLAQPGPAPIADPATQLDKVLALVGDAPAAVFWAGGADLTEPALWRHLRTLNRVLIPRGYGDDPSTRPPATGSDHDGGTHEAVLFRHADGNVLAEVLPALDTAQFARLFGPARALAFHAPDHPTPSGSFVWRALVPDDAPPPPAGMLQIDTAQMDTVERARLERSRRKVMAYLREVDPASTDALSDAELYKVIRRYEEAGNAHGLESERAHMKWAYLMSVSNGDIDKAPETRAFFRQSSKHPDDRIDDLMDLADKAWEQAGGTP